MFTDLPPPQGGLSILSPPEHMMSPPAAPQAPQNFEIFHYNISNLLPENAFKQILFAKYLMSLKYVA